jgi:uncharacterized small protein (DUF1192 family)
MGGFAFKSQILPSDANRPILNSGRANKGNTMFDDDLDPKTKRLKHRPLDKLSVDDLKNYIADLKAEITRVEDDISKKEAHKNAISNLFKKKED